MNNKKYIVELWNDDGLINKRVFKDEMQARINYLSCVTTNMFVHDYFVELWVDNNDRSSLITCVNVYNFNA